METNNDTVTISLNTYNEMKEEIILLREQVKQKEIHRYHHHPAYAYAVMYAMTIIYIIVLTLN